MAERRSWSRFHSSLERRTPSQGSTKEASGMTPVSSPIREFGILKVEHGDMRLAARAGS